MDTTALAARINAAFATGRTVFVGGRRVKTWSGEPARVWGTGSVSVDVATKRGNGTTQIWFKADAATEPSITFA